MSKTYEDLTPSAKRYLGILIDVWFVEALGEKHGDNYYLSEWHDRIQKQQFEYMDSDSCKRMRETLWLSLGFGIVSRDPWDLDVPTRGERGFLRQASHDVFEFITGLSAEEALKTVIKSGNFRILERWPKNLMADHPAEALLLSREDYALAMSEGEDLKE